MLLFINHVSWPFLGVCCGKKSDFRVILETISANDGKNVDLRVKNNTWRFFPLFIGFLAFRILDRAPCALKKVVEVETIRPTPRWAFDEAM
jgi:hypothetical protein